MFDYSSLTLGEVAFIEDISGMSISSIADDEKPKGKAMAAVVTVIKRRTGHPEFKFNDALNLPMSELDELLGIGESDEEADAAGEDNASAKSAPKEKRS